MKKKIWLNTKNLIIKKPNYKIKKMNKKYIIKKVMAHYNVKLKVFILFLNASYILYQLSKTYNDQSIIFKLYVFF